MTAKTYLFGKWGHVDPSWHILYNISQTVLKYFLVKTRWIDTAWNYVIYTKANHNNQESDPEDKCITSSRRKGAHTVWPNSHCQEGINTLFLKTWGETTLFSSYLIIKIQKAWVISKI